MVRYPTEMDDQYITDTGYSPRPSTSSASPNGMPVGQEPLSWLVGWNFTTDLYRILEHAVDELRCRWSHQNGATRFHAMFGRSPMTESAVMEQVLHMYSALPSQFRETLPVTEDPGKDLFGFQSANIQATLQLLRMVLFSTEDIGVDRKCDVAGELLSVFSKVPMEYLRAISSPLVRISAVPSTDQTDFSFSFIISQALAISWALSLKEISPRHRTNGSECFCKFTKS
jgi:hypothetical protein